MTPRQYIRYREELKANGYEYRKDCPYEGRNLWIKYPKEDHYSMIKMNVYHGFNAEGDEYYDVVPTIEMNRTDCDCELRLVINMKTNNIMDIESMFEKYVRMMDGDTEFAEAK